MEILNATSEHITELSKLFNMYRVFYKKKSDLEAAETFISERIKNDDSVIFIVVEDGNYLGFTQLYPLFSSVSMKRLWILNDLFVSESARNRGVAQLLLDAAKKFAIETRAKSLELQTANDNYTAQRLYEKNGYKIENEFISYSLSLENQK
jgi:ribosomal protein S18 acetylase RimI-like enzyme